MESATQNPLTGVTIGSKVFSSSTAQFKHSVLNKNVSQMVAQEKSDKFMSGESSYVYQGHMNEGSFGMSGAYGVSGISQFKASLAAYAGNAVAQSNKSITVNYNAMSQAGIEYIDFENLTVGSFLESLNSGANAACIKALDAYNEVMAEAGRLDVDIQTALNDPAKYPELTASINEWIHACNEFNSGYGDGLVVGVLWGACGWVQMKMESETEDSSWQYGGEASFSYSGALNPVNVNVKTTYAGSNSSSDAKVKVTCKSFCSGSKLETAIDTWFNELAGKSYKELADVEVMAKAPSLSIKDTPKIPPFEKPLVSESVASRVGKIKDLKGLEALAVASAYDEAKRKDRSLTLEQFMKDAKEKADVSGLNSTIKQVSDNSIDTLGQDNQLDTHVEKARLQSRAGMVASAVSHAVEPVSSGAPATPEGCVPLGVWISNWSDIFPWLARGFDNNVKNVGDISSLKIRVMLQDFQALNKIYTIAHNSGITNLTDKVRTSDIANAFSHGAGELQLSNANVSSIVDGLGEEARKIYKTWNDNGFLRDCELGLGLLKDDKSVSFEKVPGGSDKRQAYYLDSCSFRAKDNDYWKFSRFYSLLPLITMEGDVWLFGPERGAMSSIYDNEVVFSKPGKAKYLRFKLDTERKVLTGLEDKVICYPIPFSAAIGINGGKESAWHGMSVSTNVASCYSLRENLEQLQTRLQSLNAWTFSNSWPSDWTPDTPYTQQSIPKQYIGLAEEVTSVI
ncbi:MULTISPECIES: hypothetical protein [unclassified Pseudoalteromonas]|uniref:hypothetical protein n=1 Tax=unclassified Pseudoalteromonas TaxID=194690 RepID=UPI002097B341|nr:hypothetical protein [Pseudoalteromonas sp. XMcav2-N]MCO7190360.1 hypothetical protein [Pseudoalteromonas sp. XMcav2-N]